MDHLRHHLLQHLQRYSMMIFWFALHAREIHVLRDLDTALTWSMDLMATNGAVNLATGFMIQTEFTEANADAKLTSEIDTTEATELLPIFSLGCRVLSLKTLGSVA